MTNRALLILTAIFALLISFAIIITGNNDLTGIFIGYLTGLSNVLWLARDANKAIDQELLQGLKIYYKGLFSRLGMVTLVVITVWRFHDAWLFYLALGIAGGIFIPLILAIRQQIERGRG